MPHKNGKYLSDEDYLNAVKRSTRSLGGVATESEVSQIRKRMGSMKKASLHLTKRNTKGRPTYEGNLTPRQLKQASRAQSVE